MPATGEAPGSRGLSCSAIPAPAGGTPGRCDAPPPEIREFVKDAQSGPAAPAPIRRPLPTSRGSHLGAGAAALVGAVGQREPRMRVCPGDARESEGRSRPPVRERLACRQFRGSAARSFSVRLAYASLGSGRADFAAPAGAASSSSGQASPGASAARSFCETAPARCCRRWLFAQLTRRPDSSSPAECLGKTLRHLHGSQCRCGDEAAVVVRPWTPPFAVPLAF
jgi:hypothetical protein